MASSPRNHQRSTSRYLIRRLVRDHVSRYWRGIAFAISCMIITAGATAANAWMMQPVLDDIFVKRDEGMLLLVPVIVLTLAVINGLATYAHKVAMGRVGLRVVADLQKAMFAHLMRADIAFFQTNATGRLISRFTHDVNLLRKSASDSLTGMVKEMLTMLFLIGVMFYQDWLLAIVAFFIFPVAILPVARLGRRMRKVSDNTQMHMGEFTAILDESIQGARLVRAYGMEAGESRRANRLVDAILGLMVKAERTRAASSPIMETLGGIAVAVIIFYGGAQVLEGETTPGAFFSFVTAMLMAYKPVKTLANLNTNLQEGLAAAARVFTLLDIEPDIRDRPDARPLAVKRGAIRFDDVRFRYGGEDGDQRPALDGLTLDVPAGKTVALVGPSGAGKSTVINLIPRFYDITGGALTIDGQDVRDVTMTSLRGAVALVSQEVTLFNDTVRANIAYGRADAGDDDIAAAAKGAAAHEFITALPDGYDTIVGEHGMMLSGGQRQRISIARAMLKDAPILLLDEATSALDTESERHVQDALKRLMEGRTTLVIAHRLSTVADADIIYVMDGGRVIESGDHKTLLDRGGAYARLHALQFSATARAGIADAANTAAD